MIFLGQFKAGEIVPYAVTFHNDQGSVEDPTTPSAKIRGQDGTWSVLTVPAKLDGAIGLYGGTIDTTGLAPGLYLVSMRGVVTTDKTVGAVFSFRIIGNVDADIKAVNGSVITGVNDFKTDVSALASQASIDNVDVIVDAIKAKTDNLPVDPASNTQVNTRMAAADYTAPDNVGIANIYTKIDTEIQSILDAVDTEVAAIKAKTDNLPISPAATDDIPSKTDIAGAVWDRLLTAITTVGSIGKLIKDYLDVAVSTRLASAGYTAPDNASIATIKNKTDNLPADPASEATVNGVGVLASGAKDSADAAALSAENAELAAIAASAKADEIKADLGDASAEGTTVLAIVKEARDSAKAASDPLLNQVPGEYESGTAGHALGRIGSGQVQYISPLSYSGKIMTLSADNDYYAADGRALEWVDDGAKWPSLTGASVEFRAGTVTKGMEVVVAEGDNKKVRLELATADVVKLGTSPNDFVIRATLANTHTVTLVSGQVRVAL